MIAVMGKQVVCYSCVLLNLRKHIFFALAHDSLFALILHIDRQSIV